MELRDTINSLLLLEDDEKTCGSGRTHRLLVRILDIVTRDDQSGKIYAFLAHNQNFANDCRNLFLDLLDKKDHNHFVQISSDSVMISNCRLYFLSNQENLRRVNYDGIYEDHYSFSQRLTGFMNGVVTNVR